MIGYLKLDQEHIRMEAIDDAIKKFKQAKQDTRCLNEHAYEILIDTLAASNLQQTEAYTYAVKNFQLDELYKHDEQKQFLSKIANNAFNQKINNLIKACEANDEQLIIDILIPYINAFDLKNEHEALDLSKGRLQAFYFLAIESSFSKFNNWDEANEYINEHCPFVLLMVDSNFINTAKEFFLLQKIYHHYYDEFGINRKHLWQDKELKKSRIPNRELNAALKKISRLHQEKAQNLLRTLENTNTYGQLEEVWDTLNYAIPLPANMPSKAIEEKSQVDKEAICIRNDLLGISKDAQEIFKQVDQRLSSLKEKLENESADFDQELFNEFGLKNSEELKQALEKVREYDKAVANLLIEISTIVAPYFIEKALQSHPLGCIALAILTEPLAKLRKNLISFKDTYKTISSNANRLSILQAIASGKKKIGRITNEIRASSKIDQTILWEGQTVKFRKGSINERHVFQEKHRLDMIFTSKENAKEGISKIIRIADCGKLVKGKGNHIRTRVNGKEATVKCRVFQDGEISINTAAEGWGYQVKKNEILVELDIDIKI